MKKTLVLAALLVAAGIQAGNKTVISIQSGNAKSTMVNQSPVIDMVFAIDTTGSMGGLIRGAKEKIWSIVNTVSQARPTPRIRLGLVAYRDLGDKYVCKRFDLSDDIDSVYEKLMSFRAAGGGDTPESVNQALYEAIETMSWNQSKSCYRVVFLVGDCPPHMDYQNDVKYPASCKIARDKDIIVNTILCGNNRQAESIWRSIAQCANGAFFKVSQRGGAITISTPYDTQITRLSIELSNTAVNYGSNYEREQARKREIRAKRIVAAASHSAMAQRADYNVSEAAKKSRASSCDAINMLEDGKLDIAEIKVERLPEKLQKMDSAKRKEHIQNQLAKRRKIKKQINALSKKRREYLISESKKRGSLEKSLENNIFKSMRTQMKRKNLNLKSDQLRL